jgi:hypothetical protein
MSGPATSERSHRMRKWAPLVVLVVVVLVGGAIFVFAGSDDDNEDDATTTTPTTGGPPSGAITYEQAQEQGLDVTFKESCDTETGFVAIPSYFAPPCYANVDDNGGATAPGVTADAVKVVVYIAPEQDAVLDYVTAAIGNDDTNAQFKETTEVFTRMYNDLYQTYGREVQIQFLEATGEASDEVAARADAVRVAEEMQPFAVWGSPTLTDAFTDELAARQIICVGCSGGPDPQWFTDRAPYVYTVGGNVEQGRSHLVEYVSKQLAGRPAAHAGDPAMQSQERVFGSIYIETGPESADAAAASKAAFAENGVDIVEQQPYTLDPLRLQEQAASMIAKLKAEGVTSVILATDPVAPATFTQEATRQEYFPEWIITGSVLTDYNAFARTYDQRQWAHAFGVSTLSVRLPPESQGANFVHRWYTGDDPAADDSAGVAVLSPSLFFAGLQTAGPNLTPETFRDGMFTIATPKATTQVSLSFGRHDLWDYDDYNGIDDATEIWWDVDAVGPDENEVEGNGLYRFVDGGTRYLPGEWPERDTRAFEDEGSVTILPEPPEGERPRDYPSPAGE